MNDIINNDILKQLINNNTTEYVSCNIVNGIILKSIFKSKYERHINIGNTNIVLRHLKKLNKIVVTKRSNQKGRPTMLTPQEAKENQREANRNWKRSNTIKKNVNSLEQKEKLERGEKIDTITFKPKPSNKMLSYWLMNMFSAYEFDYFLTLNHTDKYILDKYGKEANKILNDYQLQIEQDKYTKQDNASLESLKQKVQDFINYIKNENKVKIHYYIVRFEKNIKDNWHAHIAIRLDKPNALNIHNYFNNRWLYSKFRKKTVKKIGNSKVKPKHEQIRNVLSYMFKKLDHYNLESIEYEVHGINVSTPISYIVKRDNRANYDMRIFKQLQLTA